MMNFIIIALAVCVGMLMASAVAALVLFNKRFLSWYMNKAMEMVEDVIEDIQEKFETALEN